MHGVSENFFPPLYIHFVGLLFKLCKYVNRQDIISWWDKGRYGLFYDLILKGQWEGFGGL